MKIGSVPQIGRKKQRNYLKLWKSLWKNCGKLLRKTEENLTKTLCIFQKMFKERIFDNIFANSSPNRNYGNHLDSKNSACYHYPENLGFYALLRLFFGKKEVPAYGVSDNFIYLCCRQIYVTDDIGGRLPGIGKTKGRAHFSLSADKEANALARMPLPRANRPRTGARTKHTVPAATGRRPDGVTRANAKRPCYI